MNDPRREFLRQMLQSEFEQTLDDRLDRYLSVNHQRLTGNHHFAHASAECMNLYRDAYFTSCIMQTQAVSDGIINFIGDRNGVPQQTHTKESKQDWARRLQGLGLVTTAFVEALIGIQSRYRNDFHHMNPAVATVDLESLANGNIHDLATIEREIFGCGVSNGCLVPNQPKYWDVAADGSVPGYIRP
jgi:hypothetical protein